MARVLIVLIIVLSMSAASLLFLTASSSRFVDQIIFQIKNHFQAVSLKTSARGLHSKFQRSPNEKKRK